VVPFAWTALPSWEWWALLCLMGFMGTGDDPVVVRQGRGALAVLGL